MDVKINTRIDPPPSNEEVAMARDVIGFFIRDEKPHVVKSGDEMTVGRSSIVNAVIVAFRRGKKEC